MKKRLVLILSILLLSISLILPLVSCKKNTDIEPEEKEVIPYTFVEGSSVLIKMGTYPQTIASVSADTIKANGTYDEQTGYYTYEGSLYKLVIAHPCTQEMTAVFSDGQSVVDGKEYAFKVEDIIWKLINKQLEEEDYFAYSNKVLDTAIYQQKAKIGKASNNVYYLYDSNGNLQITQEVYANNWEYSVLRSALAQFYNIAFNEDNKTAIKQVDNVNSSQDSGGDYFPSHQNNTKDYVFCLSKAQASNSRYGFTDEDKERRLREVTDYAIAKGAFYIESTDGAKFGWIWTRTAAQTSNSVYKITTTGDITASFINNDDDLKIGYVPAMRITKI